MYSENVASGLLFLPAVQSFRIPNQVLHLILAFLRSLASITNQFHEPSKLTWFGLVFDKAPDDRWPVDGLNVLLSLACPSKV